MAKYMIKQGDSPQKIAQRLTGNAGRFQELVAANPSLRRKIVGRDMQTRGYIVTFLDADFKPGKWLDIPANWRAGSVGASFGNEGENTDADTSYGDETSKTNCSFADICNPATDCWDEVACSKGGGAPGSNFCKNANMIKTVQAALGVKVDGLWGCESQCALDKSGKSFKDLAGQECQGDVPSKAGCSCGGGGQLPIPGKKKEGEACTGSDQCEAGLECIDGKCAKPGLKKTEEKSSLIWWILGGLAVGTAVVGVAYAGGAFDEKGKAKKAPAA